MWECKSIELDLDAHGSRRKSGWKFVWELQKSMEAGGSKWKIYASVWKLVKVSGSRWKSMKVGGSR